MGQIPKNIIVAQAGAKLTFKINGKPISLDEETVDLAAKNNLDKLVSSGELPQHRIKEYWDTHQKFKDNARRGIYNIDTAGPEAIAGMTYEGEISPENLGLTKEGDTAERGAFGRFFTKTLKHDPAAVMSRYNALAGVSIGDLGLKKIQEEEETSKIAQERSKAELAKAEEEKKVKELSTEKPVPISKYIQETRFGGSGKWEPLWKSMPESEKFEVLSKHAQDIVTNKEKYLKDKDTSWMTKFQKDGTTRFVNLNDLRDFYSHIYGGEGLEYIIPGTESPTDKTKLGTDKTKEQTKEQTKDQPVNQSKTLPQKEFMQKFDSTKPFTLSMQPSSKEDLLKIIGDKKVSTPTGNPKAEDLIKKKIDDLKKTHSMSSSYHMNQYSDILSDIIKGESIDNYISRLEYEIKNYEENPNPLKGFFHIDNPVIAKKRKIEKLQDIKKELNSTKSGKVLKGQDGFSFPDIFNILNQGQSNIKIPFAPRKQSTTQGITVPFASGKEPERPIPTPALKSTEVGKGQGIDKSGISKLAEKFPKLSEDQVSNLRELARVAILNKFQPDVTVEAPMIIPAAEVRAPIRGDYTTMGLASQEATKIKSGKPFTSDPILAEMSSQEREGKAGEIEMQGKMADLQARKQGEVQDLEAQQRSNIARGEVASRNIQSLAQKKQAEREAKNMLSRQRVENWDTFLAQMNLKREAKMKETGELKKQFALKDLYNKLYTEPQYTQYMKELRTGQVSPETARAYRDLEQQYENMTRSIQLGETPKMQGGGTMKKSDAAIAKELWKQKIKSSKALSDIYEKWMNKKVSEQEKDTDKQSKQLYDLVRQALK